MDKLSVVGATPWESAVEKRRLKTSRPSCRCRLAFAQKKVSPQATHRAESATPERKSTSRYGNEKKIYPQFFNFW